MLQSGNVLGEPRGMDVFGPRPADARVAGQVSRLEGGTVSLSHEEKIALVYAIIYAVPVLAICAFFSFRVAGRSNRSFRAYLPFIAVGFATVVGVGLAVAAHYMPTVEG
ncbi:MAG: hypothetical protein JWM93_3426 [Frankiales bacterium]|nr:hypothetical protein [Frankiales bacterium]